MGHHHGRCCTKGKLALAIRALSELERLVALVAIRGASAGDGTKDEPRRKLWLVHAALCAALPDDYAKTHTNPFLSTFVTITG